MKFGTGYRLQKKFKEILKKFSRDIKICLVYFCSIVGCGDFIEQKDGDRILKQ